MTETIVVNLRKESYDIYIGRGSEWGNPYIIGRDGTREEVIEKYKVYFLSKPSLVNKVKKLRGKKLGCYCSPLACHGDILKELADNEL